MLAQRLQASFPSSRTKIPYYVVVCLATVEAAIFLTVGNLSSTPLELRRRTKTGELKELSKNQLSASRLLLCFFWSCVCRDFSMELLYGSSHCPWPWRHVSSCISTSLKYFSRQNGSLLYGSDTSWSRQFFSAAPTPPTGHWHKHGACVHSANP